MLIFVLALMAILFNKFQKVDKEKFKIYLPGEINQRQKVNKMVVYDNHTFKVPNSLTVTNFLEKNRRWKELYVCCHASHQCTARFLIDENGDAYLENTHREDIFHLHDIQMNMRREIRIFIKKEIEANIDIRTREIYCKLLENFPLDANFPPKSYLAPLISNLKRNVYGYSPKKKLKI